MKKSLEFLVGKATHKVEIEKEEEHYKIRIGEETYNVNSENISENCISIIVDGNSYQIFLAEENGKQYVSVRGEKYVIEKPEQISRGKSALGSTLVEGVQTVSAPMPGNIVKVNVNEGDEVREKQTLVILEAMKMENEIQSPKDGVVQKVYIEVGQLVDFNAPLVEVE